ncbi:MAG: hypothetical protein GC139_01535 [Sideroxydans sp.]|nr:hypothetical protein [Sideroxydans sp.]
MMNPKLIKTLMLLIALAGLAGCEEKIDYKKEEGLNFDVGQDLQSALQQKRMPQLAIKLGCNNCHALDHKLVGPAWQDVGKRYQDATDYEYDDKHYPVAEGLVQKISHGGSGNWGVEAMPALDPSGAEHEKLEKLVGFILKLGKQ